MRSIHNDGDIQVEANDGAVYLRVGGVQLWLNMEEADKISRSLSAAASALTPKRSGRGRRGLSNRMKDIAENNWYAAQQREQNGTAETP